MNQQHDDVPDFEEPLSTLPEERREPVEDSSEHCCLEAVNL